MPIDHTTSVAYPVAPGAETTGQASHLERFGQGGYRSVQTLADRDAIVPERRAEGMLVFVINEEKIYQLTGTTFEPLDDDEGTTNRWVGGTWAELALGGGGSGPVTTSAVQMWNQTTLEQDWEVDHNLTSRIVDITVISPGYSTLVATQGRIPAPADNVALDPDQTILIPEITFESAMRAVLTFAEPVAGTAVVRR